MLEISKLINKGIVYVSACPAFWMHVTERLVHNDTCTWKGGIIALQLISFNFLHLIT
jgi:hypothetical protein